MSEFRINTFVIVQRAGSSRHRRGRCAVTLDDSGLRAVRRFRKEVLVDVTPNNWVSLSLVETMTGLPRSYTPRSGRLLRLDVQLLQGSQGLGIVVPDEAAERWLEEAHRVFESAPKPSS